VAGYEPLPSEPGSYELLEELTARGVEVLVPVTLPDRDLDWRRAHSGPTDRTLGVGAVARVDCVLAPALAVAADGTRLGRGGGSYDRALARLPARTVVAALVYDDELVDALPRDAWDVAVDAVVTPSGWRDLAVGTRRPAGRNAGMPPPR
jgi:5-formyltetrahydrofolate cyclo-ligase